MNTDPLVESIAHFLYWSGWLEQHDKGDVGAIVIECDGFYVQVGTATFERLLASLEKVCPRWRELNTHYKCPEVDAK